MLCIRMQWKALSLLLLSTLPARVLGGDVLSTDGYSTCVDNPAVQVTALNIQYDRSTNLITFDVAGSSSEAQNVTASLTVSAYGEQVYQKDFDPCDSDTYVKQLCPGGPNIHLAKDLQLTTTSVPSGTFSAIGSQIIPSSYAAMIPSIAFTIPDLDGQAKLELKSSASGQELACIQSTVTNGRSMNVAAVSYVAAGVAASAFAITAVGAFAIGGHAGAATASPNFGEVLGWFQGLATNGMLSVAYPQVYHSFTKNFAFSTGLLRWGQMQLAIDNFRASTGGNLTEDNYQYLQDVTLVYTSNSSSSSTSSVFKRGLDTLLFGREVTTSVNGSSTSLGSSITSSNTTGSTSKAMHYVSGIEAYVEQLSIPQANTFMTVLLVFACVIALITVAILLFKVILEAIALSSSLPKSLESFRKRYWWRLAKTITQLILLLYGIWTLYCVYQFTNGDSWAAKALAGVTWLLFTSLLAFFAIKIWLKAREAKKLQGDASALFENKETWIKYSLFYDSYKKGYWWIFIPSIIYMFARNAVIAAAHGHGMVQAVGQMIVEAIFLICLLWFRPYQLKSANWINIVIQVVRVISVICILVFVEELGMSQSTKTITGIVLIVVQSVLTGVLAILIAVNAIIACVRENPHRKKRKEAGTCWKVLHKDAQANSRAEKNRDLDDLTPLDARNSLLMDSPSMSEYKLAYPDTLKKPFIGTSLHSVTTNESYDQYDIVPPRTTSPPGYERSQSRPGIGRDDSRTRLVSGASSIGDRERSQSPPSREPRLPDFSFEKRH